MGGIHYDFEFLPFLWKKLNRGFMEQNPELSLVWRFIESTGTHLFLTGKAGTGKTTFLRRLKEKSPKRMVVLAPTGIAAINAGGVTIHSFFQLPFIPYVPDVSLSPAGGASAHYRFNREKLSIIRSIDLLVIDEISMVRADLLDAVDNALRRFRDRSRPFGGVQVLMIGDLQQLSPVVKDDEWNLLQHYYETPYFFSSHVLKATDYCVVELQTVYRQQDATFIQLLNRVRENRCDAKVLAQLNKRYIPQFRPNREDGYIHLVTHNYQAQQINEQELSDLPGRSYQFRARVEGKFPEYAYPTDEVLELKNEAQVMFVKNDSSGNHRYYNGLLGKIVEVSERGVVVQPYDGLSAVLLQEEVWSNTRYVLDEKSNEIREEVEGTFSQLPIKTAWAITIHKSQGLTFERAIIDVSASFAHGQTYVALSRCKSLDGLVLSAPLSADAIISDEMVDDFTSRIRLQRPDEHRLQTLQRSYFLELLSDLFDFNPLKQALSRYVRVIDEFLYRLYPKQLLACKKEVTRFQERVTDVAQKFKSQYMNLVAASSDCAMDTFLQERIHQAAAYFGEQLELLEVVVQEELNSDNKDIRKKLNDALEDLTRREKLKKGLLNYVYSQGFHVSDYLKHKAVLSIEVEAQLKEKTVSVQKRNKRTEAVKVPSDILHPELYNRLVKWRNAEAADLGVPVYLVLRQQAILGISNLLPTDTASLLCIPYLGKKGVDKYGDAILQMVEEYRLNHK